MTETTTSRTLLYQGAGTYEPGKHLMTLARGGDYLPVAQRIVWMRTDFPESTVTTELETLDVERGFALFKASITRIGPGGEWLGQATGWGSETRNDFGDFVEKAETKAIGRALAALGYGTSMAPELDEGERIADAPIVRTINPNKGAPVDETPRQPATPVQAPNGFRPMSDAQRKKIATEANVRVADVDGLLRQRFQMEPTKMSTRDASAVIEALMAENGTAVQAPF